MHCVEQVTSKASRAYLARCSLGVVQSPRQSRFTSARKETLKREVMWCRMSLAGYEDASLSCEESSVTASLVAIPERTKTLPLLHSQTQTQFLKRQAMFLSHTRRIRKEARSDGGRCSRCREGIANTSECLLRSSKRSRLGMGKGKLSPIGGGAERPAAVHGAYGGKGKNGENEIENSQSTKT